ncbi:MAG: M13 family peptidase, partial [Gemmatimonadales bacterium]
MRLLPVRPGLCSLLFLLLGTTLSLDLAAQQAGSLDAADFDTTCAACRDFFQFANGGWLKRTVIPGDQPAWGGFNELQEQNYQELQEVLDQAAAQATKTQDPGTHRLGTFYGACMDTVRIEAAGAAPLATDLKAIAGVRSRRAVQQTLARLARYQISVPFSFHSTPDLKNSSRVIAEVTQSGLGLPDRDYYTREDSASQALRVQYTDHIGRMLRLLGDDSAAAARSAQTILALETVLARASMTQVQLRDPDSTYHLTRLADLQKLTPAFSWNAYLGDLGQRGVTEANVGQPAFLREVDSIYRATPVDDWKTYLRWHLLTNSAAALSRPFDTENFRFKSTVLQGISEMRPRWKRCLARTDDAMGELLGQAYVAQHFTPEAKAKALDMVHNILAEFRHRLTALEWMTDATKTKAYAKLDAIVTKIGYPDRWRDYSRLPVEPDAFLANLHHATVFEVARDLSKIGKPLDRAEWPFSPPTVNAG